MIFYLKNPINSTKRLLKPVNELSQFVVYKINTQNELFLYTNNEQFEKEIKRTSLTIASKEENI